MFGVPIEYLMFGGIGFCLAWLTALMVLPAVHNRAMRLARERYDDLPLSIQEIRAEKDTIRAGFATATRELELRIDKLREKTAAHATDVARKNQLIDRLTQEIVTVTAALRDSESREQAARDALRETKRGVADKDVTLGSAEGEIAVLKRDIAAKDIKLRAIENELAAMSRELAARDAALRATERDLAGLRSELAGKDTALTHAEREIAAIKAEIAALSTLIVQHSSNSRSQPERPAGAPRLVEVVPFVPASRPRAAHEPAQPQTARQPVPSEVARQAFEPPVAHRDGGRTPPRAPIDLVAGPTRLIPPTIPQAPQQGNDSVGRALTEITDAARRVDERQPGPNQRLRAAYAPFVKNST
jgi:predicted  nucleic acid-binding Zn-ribbon protein